MSSSKNKKTKHNHPVAKKERGKSGDSNEDAITPELAEVIKDLPKDKREIVVKALLISKHHSGPLPDGQTIRVYNEVIPNGGDRLMKNVEKQLNHRIEIEKEGVQKSFIQSNRGQIFGFIIALAFGFIAWDLAKSGFEVSASILGTVDLVALVAIFITGKRRK